MNCEKTKNVDIVVNNTRIDNVKYGNKNKFRSNNFSSSSSSSILSEGAESLVLVLGSGEQGTQRTNNNLLEDSPGTIGQDRRESGAEDYREEGDLVLHNPVYSSGKLSSAPGRGIVVPMEKGDVPFLEEKMQSGRRAISKKIISSRQLIRFSPDKATIDRVCGSISAIAGLGAEDGCSTLLVEKVRAIVQNSYDTNSHELGIVDAQKWADGFQLDDAEVTESSRLFETLGYDLEALARVLQTRPGRQESRFNKD